MRISMWTDRSKLTGVEKSLNLSAQFGNQVDNLCEKMVAVSATVYQHKANDFSERQRFFPLKNSFHPGESFSRV